MGEAIGREVAPIDSEDLIEGGIVVHGGKHDRVDAGERLVDVVGEYFSSPSMGASASWAYLKQFGGTVHQPEDGQRDPRVPARTHSSVVSELGKCLA